MLYTPDGAGQTTSGNVVVVVVHCAHFMVLPEKGTITWAQLYTLGMKNFAAKYFIIYTESISSVMSLLPDIAPIFTYAISIKFQAL